MVEWASTDARDGHNTERQTILSIGAGGSVDRLDLKAGKFDGSEAFHKVELLNGGVSYPTFGTSLARTHKQFYRTALRIKDGDIGFAVDGVLHQGTPGTKPLPAFSGVNLQLGGTGLGNNSYLDGFIRRFFYWPAMHATNAQLEIISDPLIDLEP